MLAIGDLKQVILNRGEIKRMRFKTEVIKNRGDIKNRCDLKQRGFKRK